MQKQVIIALVLTLFIPSIVSAHDDENVTKRRPDTPQIQEIRQENKTDRQEKRSDVARLHAERLEKHFGFYYTRLNNIITRFQSRLDSLKAAGKDTTAVQTKLDAAKAKVTEAKVKGDAAIAAFKAIDPAKFSEQRTAVLAARDLAKAARELFQETHELLKEAVRLLKTISKP